MLQSEYRKKLDDQNNQNHFHVKNCTIYTHLSKKNTDMDLLAFISPAIHHNYFKNLVSESANGFRGSGTRVEILVFTSSVSVQIFGPEPVPDTRPTPIFSIQNIHIKSFALTLVFKWYQMMYRIQTPNENNTYKIILNFHSRQFAQAESR